MIKLVTAVRKYPMDTGWVVEGERKIRVSSGVRKNVLSVLADHADKAGRCRLRISTIALETGLGDRSVRRALQTLEADGYVERRVRHGAGGQRIASEYEVVLEATVAAPTGHGGRAKEPSIEPELLVDAASASTGGVRRKMLDSSAWEQDPGYLREEKPKSRPSRTEKKSSTRPDTAMALAYRLRKKAKRVQPHVVDPVKVERVACIFARWKRDPENPVTAQEIRVAMDLCCEDLRGQGVEAPLGAVFVKQAPRWIEAARQRIYEEETLPRLRRQHSRLWDHVHEDFARWTEENPAATRDQQHAMKRALYEAWKKELGVE